MFPTSAHQHATFLSPTPADYSLYPRRASAASLYHESHHHSTHPESITPLLVPSPQLGRAASCAELRAGPSRGRSETRDEGLGLGGERKDVFYNHPDFGALRVPDLEEEQARGECKEANRGRRARSWSVRKFVKNVVSW